MASWSDFQSMHMKLARMAHFRQDLFVQISQLAQVTEQHFVDYPRKVIKRLNSAVKYENENHAHMTYLKLDIGTPRIIGYSNMAFASNIDLTSFFGRELVLEDADGYAVQISFKYYKSKLVARMVLAFEVIAFADLLK